MTDPTRPAVRPVDTRMSFTTALVLLMGYIHKEVIALVTDHASGALVAYMSGQLQAADPELDPSNYDEPLSFAIGDGGGTILLDPEAFLDGRSDRGQLELRLGFVWLTITPINDAD